MKRLKKAARSTLLLSISLCLISGSVWGEHGWTEDPPQYGKDDYTGAPGPRGSAADGISSNRGEAVSLSFIIEVSYRVIGFATGYGGDFLGDEQGWFEPLEEVESNATVNHDQKKD